MGGPKIEKLQQVKTATTIIIIIMMMIMIIIILRGCYYFDKCKLSCIWSEGGEGEMHNARYIGLAFGGGGRRERCKRKL